MGSCVVPATVAGVKMNSRRSMVSSQRKGPGTPVPRPESKGEQSQDERTESKSDHRRGRRRKDEDPAQQRKEARQRIQPHSIRAWHLWLAPPQQRERADLADELHKNAHRDERVD